MIGRSAVNKALPVARPAEGWGPHTGEVRRPSPVPDGAARADDETAQRFVNLYRELLPPIFGFIRFRVGDLHLAEDLTAQVFERALARLATVREPERVRAWLFTIARTAIVDHRRGRRISTALEAADLVEHLWIDSPEHEAEQREEWRRVVAYVGSLGERERELIGLKFAAGLTNREIGQILDLSEANVAQIIHRAIVKLRRRFDEEEHAS
jgi:RNA polymerase sigma factor (sigma-70 family)